MYIFQSSRLESIGRFSGFAEPSMKSIKSDLTDLERSLDGPRLSPVSTKDPASTSAGGLSQSVTSRIQRDCDPVQRGPPCCCHDALPRTVVRSCQVEPWMPTVIPLNHNHIWRMVIFLPGIGHLNLFIFCHFFSLRFSIWFSFSFRLAFSSCFCFFWFDLQYGFHFFRCGFQFLFFFSSI